MQFTKLHAVLLQTTVFVWICSDDNEWMDDDDKPVKMIATLCQLASYQALTIGYILFSFSYLSVFPA